MLRSVCYLAALWLIGCGGCGDWLYSPPKTPEELARRLADGFSKDHPRLFISARGIWSSSRIGELVTALGYDWDELSCFAEHNVDGTRLCLWNDVGDRVLIIAKDKPPEFRSTPKGACLDNDGNMFCLPDMKGRRVRIDQSGRFFCKGGWFYDDVAQKRKMEPINIYAISRPSKPLITSKIDDGIPWKIFAAKGKLYLMIRQSGARDTDPAYVVCEEYAYEHESLQFIRTFEIHSPNKRVAHIVPIDFDFVTGKVLLRAHRDMPSMGPLWYLYDVDTGEMEGLGVINGYARFLDPGIFSGALEYLRSTGIRTPDSVHQGREGR